MSWKQYGGVRKNDKLNNLALGTLVADDIILRQVKVTTHIFDDTIIAKKDIKVERNLDVSNNVDVSGQLVVHNNIYTPNYVIGVDKDVLLNFEDPNGYRAYISADVNNEYIGFGTNAPKTFIDISSTVVDSFAIRNNLPYIRNILTQNQNDSGIAIDTSMNTSNIGFFYQDVSNSLSVPRSKITADTFNSILTLDSSTNNIVSKKDTNITSEYATTITTISGDISLNSESIYLTGVSGDIVLASKYSTIITSISGDIDISANEGDITITSFDSTKLRSSVAISERETTRKLKNEPFTIYDNSETQPFAYKYYNDIELKTGNSSISVAVDNSSTTFSHLLTPDVKGLSIGGGAYVKDSSRSMGIIGLSTTDISFVPSQSFVSNKDSVVYRTTTGINTYAPRLNNYVMDINGPTRIGNGELHPIIQHTSKLTDIRSSKDNLNYIFTAGRREEEDINNNKETFGYASSDSGKTWKKVLIEDEDTLTTNSLSIFAIGDKAYILSSNARIHRYDFSNETIDLYNRSLNNLTTNSIYVKNFGNNSHGILIGGANAIYYTKADTISSTGLQSIPSITTQISNIVASDGYGDKVYFVGNGIQTVIYSSISTEPVLEHKSLSGEYNTISAYTENNAVAGGVNEITYTLNGGNSWNVIDNIIIDNVTITEFVITQIHMLSDGNGLAIGTYTSDTNSYTKGMILYTQNGGSHWKSIPREIAFYSFGNEDILRQSNINGVCISKDGSFVFTNVTKEVTEDTGNYDSGSSTIYYGLYPALFDVYNNKVLDVNGGMNVNGQIKQF